MEKQRRFLLNGASWCGKLVAGCVSYLDLDILLVFEGTNPELTVLFSCENVAPVYQCFVSKGVD